MSKIAAIALLALKWCLFAALCSSNLWASAAPTGVFESHADVGSILHPGTLEYDAARGTYTVGGSGENVWSTADAFHFVWKKVAGDLSLAADVSFLSKGGNEHRKAVLMVSSYLPELLGLCDRIAVMRRGRLGAPQPAANRSEHELMMAATGGGSGA